MSGDALQEVGLECADTEGDSYFGIKFRQESAEVTLQKEIQLWLSAQGAEDDFAGQRRIGGQQSAAPVKQKVTGVAPALHQQQNLKSDAAGWANAWQPSG